MNGSNAYKVLHLLRYQKWIRHVCSFSITVLKSFSCIKDKVIGNFKMLKLSFASFLLDLSALLLYFLR